VICTNKYTYLQVIDDTQAKTLAAANDLMLIKAGQKLTGTKTQKAKQIATFLADSLKKNKISKLAFDRGMRRYHGRVKSVAEEMRAQGINV
jgi:large subunit ribosomal protein L18